MKTKRWLISLGLIGVISFLAMDILGTTFWNDYNPITDYISKLLADEAPHVRLSRVLMNLYNICFCLYALTLSILSFRRYHICVRTAYTTIFLIAVSSLLGYGAVPVSIEFIFSANDIFHFILTIVILCLTTLALLLLAIGYIKQEHLQMLGRLSLAIFIIFLLFNGWHILAVFTGKNILGLVERLTFYTFHTLTFITSWVFVFKKDYI